MSANRCPENGPRIFGFVQYIRCSGSISGPRGGLTFMQRFWSGAKFLTANGRAAPQRRHGSAAATKMNICAALIWMISFLELLVTSARLVNKCRGAVPFLSWLQGLGARAGSNTGRAWDSCRAHRARNDLARRCFPAHVSGAMRTVMRTVRAIEISTPTCVTARRWGSNRCGVAFSNLHRSGSDELARSRRRAIASDRFQARAARTVRALKKSSPTRSTQR